MKYILTFLLLVISLVSFGQQPDFVKLKLKSGEEYQLKIESIDNSKIKVITQTGKKSTQYAYDIESIDGIPYKEFYKERGEYFNNYEEASQAVTLPLNEAGEIEYSEVVQVSDVAANELFVRAKEWIALTFNSANHVIQMDDKEAGKLIGKGRSEIFTSHPYSENRIVSYGHIDYTIEIQTKEGRYKYVISGISHEFNAYVNPLSGAVMQTPGNILAQPEPTTGLKVNKKTWQLVRYATDQKINQIILSLKEKMKQSSGRDDDW